MVLGNSLDDVDQLVVSLAGIQLGPSKENNKTGRLTREVFIPSTSQDVDEDGPTPLRALLDSGADVNLINQSLVVEHELPIATGVALPRAKSIDDHKLKIYGANRVTLTYGDNYGVVK